MNHDEHSEHGHMMHGSYARFGAMIAASTAIMFVLMYALVFRFDHVRFSDTRVFAAFYMGAAMAIIMLAFMLGMFRNRRLNAGIFVASALVLVAALYLARSQRVIGDVGYMKAMIPHHSIAILTSTRAQISDPRVRRLADQIIETQNREIAEMNTLIAELEGR